MKTARNIWRCLARLIYQCAQSSLKTKSIYQFCSDGILCLLLLLLLVTSASSFFLLLMIWCYVKTRSNASNLPSHISTIMQCVIPWITAIVRAASVSHWFGNQSMTIYGAKHYGISLERQSAECKICSTCSSYEIISKSEECMQCSLLTHLASQLGIIVHVLGTQFAMLDTT